LARFATNDQLPVRLDEPIDQKIPLTVKGDFNLAAGSESLIQLAIGVRKNHRKMHSHRGDFTIGRGGQYVSLAAVDSEWNRRHPSVLESHH